jgi:hypothetical protein
MGIHLAPESLEEEGFWGSHDKSEYKAFRSCESWSQVLAARRPGKSSISEHDATETVNASSACPVFGTLNQQLTYQ